MLFTILNIIHALCLYASEFMMRFSDLFEIKYRLEVIILRPKTKFFGASIQISNDDKSIIIDDKEYKTDETDVIYTYQKIVTSALKSRQHKESVELMFHYYCEWFGVEFNHFVVDQHFIDTPLKWLNEEKRDRDFSMRVTDLDEPLDYLDEDNIDEIINAEQIYQFNEDGSFNYEQFFNGVFARNDVQQTDALNDVFKKYDFEIPGISDLRWIRYPYTDNLWITYDLSITDVPLYVTEFWEVNLDDMMKPEYIVSNHYALHDPIDDVYLEDGEEEIVFSGSIIPNPKQHKRLGMAVIGEAWHSL